MACAGNGHKRVVVIGLDGVPFNLLQDLAQNGVMPAMAQLLEAGHLHRMKASLPEISSVSWTSFMTGTNPGTHGIFGFTDLHERTYRLRFPNFLDVKSPTIWDQLAARGHTSIVINQPFTYPARKMNGALVSGFVAIELAQAVYPHSHLASLQKMGYRIDIDTLQARQDREFLKRELMHTLEGGQRALDYFWKQDWDYFEFVVTGTDRLHHYLWSAHADPSHPCSGDFRDYYRKVDDLIGRIVENFRELTGDIHGLYLLSDHGFTGIVQEVYLNKWLEKSGFLKFDASPAQRLADMAPGTRAFALDPNRIYLNLMGKFPRGTVSVADRKMLKEEIAAAARELQYNGKNVIRTVFDTDEIYSGPQIAKGPDLIFLAENGFDMKSAIDRMEIMGRSDLDGMHTWDDAFFWAVENCGSDLMISDLAAIILENFE
jgi:predicted AlkP superfamily phosphohydrolase/phosphomutase